MRTEIATVQDAPIGAGPRNDTQTDALLNCWTDGSATPEVIRTKNQSKDRNENSRINLIGFFRNRCGISRILTGSFLALTHCSLIFLKGHHETNNRFNFDLGFFRGHGRICRPGERKWCQPGTRALVFPGEGEPSCASTGPPARKNSDEPFHREYGLSPRL